MSIEQRPLPLDVPGGPALSLRRVHLRAVGPRAARLDPFDLRHDTPDGSTAARVLWSLTNTGGKTTIMRLTTSVVVPAARAQMGGANIGEYVDTGDTSHVVLEWDIAGGDCFVVGAVYEWPGRKRPHDAPISELRRYFYVFRCNGITIDDLPFSVDRRRRTLEEFRNEVRELMGAHPAAQFAGTANQGEWAKLLDTRTPLDPELFRYQMRMNDAESGAEALVKKLTSAESIVRFFIEALNDDVGIAEFTDTLGDYARHSAKRSALTVEEAFCSSVSAALDPLAGAEVVRTTARNDNLLAGQRVAEFAGELAARIAAEEVTLADLRTQADETATEVARLDNELKRQSDLRQQLLLEDARFDAADAAAHLEHATAHLAAVESERDAWAATETVSAWRVEQRRVAASERAYAEAEGELVPLRNMARDAAADLAAKYAALADEAVEAKARAAVALKTAEDTKSRAERRVNAAYRAELEADARLRAIDDAATDSTATLGRLVSEGHASAGEMASAALARWTRDVAAAADVRARLTSVRNEAKAQQATATKAAEAARRDVARREADHERARKQLDDYLGDLAAVADDEDVAAVADELAGSPIDGISVAAAVAERAEGRAGVAERSAADAETKLREVERQLDHLERGDLLATGADIELVKQTLADGGVPAVTGWEWLARNVADPEERRRRIAARPDVANGVIVTDASRLADARAVLTRNDLELRVAVLVAPSAATTAREEPTEGFVVEPHRALWDREWAERTRDQMRGRRDELQEAAQSARDSAGRYRRASVGLSQLVRRWPANVAAALPTALAEAEAAVAATTDVLHTAEGVLADAETAVSAAQEGLEGAVAAAGEAKVHVEAVRHGAALETAAARLAATHPDVVAALDGAKADQATAGIERDTGGDAAKEAQARISDAGVRAETYRDKQRDVGVEPATTVSDTPLDQLVASVDQLRRELAGAEAGSDHAARLTEATERAAQARAKVDEVGADIVEAAEKLLSTFEAASSGMRAEELRRAETKLRAAMGAQAGAQLRSTQADALVEERRPTGRNVHHPLDDEWSVTDRADVAAKLERLNEASGANRTRLNELTADLDDIKSIVATSETDLERFGIAVDSLGADALAGMRAYPGNAVDAQAAATRLVTERRAAEQVVNKAEDAWHHALANVRAAAGSTQWSTFDSVWKKRLVDGSGDEIADEARASARTLRIRAQSLVDELADLDRHREALVMKLEQLCATQLRLLREVTNSSRLPDQMGELSRMPAFKIDFEKAAPSEARGRLATRVDRWAEELSADPKKAGRNDQRYRWLAEATKDLVVERPRAGAWSVQVLKPVVDGTVEYRTPDRIPVEFSGGQELTLAVLLYCTLSQVRAQNRTSGARPAGVLLLDNPFGRASNPALIRMQQALAGRAGLQLICATGLSDASVKTAFEGDDSVILELRNDRDQRHGLQYLRVADPRVAAIVAAGITGDRDVESTDGYLDGTRYTVRR